MFLYVRRSFMILKILLACTAFIAAIIALLGTPQNSLLLTQDTGRQLGIIMALVFGIVTIVEAFMAPPEAIISDKLLGGWRTAPDSPLVRMHKTSLSASPYQLGSSAVSAPDNFIWCGREPIRNMLLYRGGPADAGPS